MGVGNLNYIPHIHGITSLLTRNGPSSLTDEVMRSVFYSNITFEVESLPEALSINRADL